MSVDKAKELANARDKLEKELEFNLNTLTSLGVGMDGSLHDSEGFPRADIDLYVVREARQKVNMLRNDLKSLMHQIELELHAIHAKARESNPTLTPTPTPTPTPTHTSPTP